MDCPSTHPTTPGARELRPVQGSALIRHVSGSRHRTPEPRKSCQLLDVAPPHTDRIAGKCRRRQPTKMELV